MPDRGNDRHRTRRDRAHEPLLAEGQKIVERAAAAREHEHVDLRLVAEPPQRLDDRGRCSRPLDVGLRDEHARRRKARADRREHVALCRSIVSGHEPDAPRQAWQRPLALFREESLRRELRLQPLDCGEVRADSEAFDRERAQPELTTRLVQLGPSEDVHALAVREVEAQRVEAAARHRGGQAGAVLWILQREEDGRPALVAPQLRDLAFDPHGRQSRDPPRDALVERCDGVELRLDDHRPCFVDVAPLPICLHRG